MRTQNKKRIVRVSDTATCWPLWTGWMNCGVQGHTENKTHPVSPRTTTKINSFCSHQLALGGPPLSHRRERLKSLECENWPNAELFPSSELWKKNRRKKGQLAPTLLLSCHSTSPESISLLVLAASFLSFTHPSILSQIFNSHTMETLMQEIRPIWSGGLLTTLHPQGSKVNARDRLLGTLKLVLLRPYNYGLLPWWHLYPVREDGENWGGWKRFESKRAVL